MDKEKRIRLFYYFVIGVLEASVPNESKFEAIIEEVKAIKEMGEKEE